MKKVKGIMMPAPRPQHAGLVVRRSKAGLGLYATQPIKKGAFLIEYWGELIPNDEADRRGGKYLFEFERRKQTIDGTARKNTARYINHSCKPNAEPIERAGHMYIYAKRNIKPGEELTYDYGEEYFDEHIKPYGCRCGNHAKR